MDERTTRDLEIIVELFRKGELRELLVRGPELSLRLSTDADSGEPAAAPRAAARPRGGRAAAAASPRGSATGDGGKRGEGGAMPIATAPAAAIDPAWTAVIAPNLGTFYRSPKPGSPAFVEVGQSIAAGTEVCLIEVMKLFTSVRTEVAGTVRHIAAEDAQLVEGGQPLIYIEAD
jgi:acetyl-CoA carboxylase biotin carboxyl carrier protein